MLHSNQLNRSPFPFKFISRIKNILRCIVYRDPEPKWNQFFSPRRRIFLGAKEETLGRAWFVSTRIDSISLPCDSYADTQYTVRSQRIFPKCLQAFETPIVVDQTVRLSIPLPPFSLSLSHFLQSPLEILSFPSLSFFLHFFLFRFFFFSFFSTNLLFLFNRPSLLSPLFFFQLSLSCRLLPRTFPRTHNTSPRNSNFWTSFRSVEYGVERTPASFALWNYNSCNFRVEFGYYLHKNSISTGFVNIHLYI